MTSQGRADEVEQQREADGGAVRPGGGGGVHAGAVREPGAAPHAGDEAHHGVPVGGGVAGEHAEPRAAHDQHITIQVC